MTGKVHFDESTLWLLPVPVRLPDGRAAAIIIDLRCLGFDSVSDMKTCDGWWDILETAVQRRTGGGKLLV